MRRITLLVLFLSTLWGYSQVKNYKFTLTSGNSTSPIPYVETSGGTVLGDTSSDAQCFVAVDSPLGSTTVFTGTGLPIGFNFTFNGVVYDKFAVSTDGWISLGLSNQVDCTVTDPTLPLSSTAAVATNLSARIAALAMDLKGQTGSSISYQTIGTGTNQVLVVQWKGFRKATTTATNESINFQIRLNQADNSVTFAYSAFTNIASTSTPQVGLRSDSSDFINRSGSSLTNNTTGAIPAATVSLSAGVAPGANGITLTWAPPVCVASTLTTLNENFDSGLATPSVKGLPDCWSRVLTGTGDAYLAGQTLAPLSAPFRLALTGNASTTSGVTGAAYVILPALSNLEHGATTTNRLRFKAYASVVNATFDVGYMTDLNDGATFHSLQQIVVLGNGAGTYTEFIIKPANIPSTVTNLVFRNNGFANAASTINIDDVVWEPIPDPIIATATYIMENFDVATTTTALPAGWAKVPGTGGAISTNISSTYPNPTGLNALTLSGTTTALYSMVALPPVSNHLTDGVNLLKFNVRGSVAGAILEIGYMTDLADINTYQAITTVTDTQLLSWGNRRELPLGTFTTAPSFYLVFKNPGLPVGTIYIDNVSWEKNTAVTCHQVSALATSSVSTTSVGLSWTAGGGPGETWQYAIAADATLSNPFALTPVDITSATTTTITGLAPATPYRVWLRSKCTNDVGSWVGPINFTTLCDPIAGITQQSFEGSTTPPACWNKLVGFSSIGATNAHTGTNSLSLYSGIATLTGPASSSLWALPAISNVGSGNYRISFWMKNSGAGTAVIEVGYLTNPSDLTSFNRIQTFSSNTTSYVQQAFGLGQFTGSEVLAFRYIAVAGAPTPVYIDDIDVNINPSPLCVEISNLIPTAATSNSVSIDWTEATGQTTWQYVTGPSSAIYPTGLNPVDVATLSQTTIGNLTADTSYNIWVRPKGTDCFGGWTGPLNVRTTCASVTDFTENFENTSYNVLPACWNNVGDGGKLYVTSLNRVTGKGIAMGATQVNGNYTITNPMILAMPPISNLTAGDHVLKFMYAGDNLGDILEIGYLTNILDRNSYVPLENAKFIIDDNTVLKRGVIQFTGAIPAGVNTIAFKNASQTPTYIYLDDVFWGPASTAVPAACTGITSVPDANCGNYATAISWQGVPDADGYKLTIGTSQGGNEILDAKAIFALNYSFKGDVAKTYYYTVTPFNLKGNATGSVEQHFTTNTNGCYCTSSPGGIAGQGITSVQLGATNFVKAPADRWVRKVFTSQPVNLNVDEQANVKMTFDTRQGIDNYGPTTATRAWIDFNNDFLYDSDELVFDNLSGITTDGPVTKDCSFQMPDIAKAGMHSMRVISTALGRATLPNACYSDAEGATLEFKVNLIAPVNNDTPAGAELLTVGKAFSDNAKIGSNANATGSIVEKAPGCGNYNGMDVWYKAVVPASGSVIFEVNSVVGGLTNTAAAVYKGDLSALNLVECNDSSSTAGDDQPKIRVNGQTSGDVLYLRVWENGGDALGQYKVSAYSTVPQAVTNGNALTNTDCGNYATQISWTAVTDATGYKLKVGTTSGASDLINNQDLGNVLTYPVIGLSASTYYFTVTPYNTNGDAVGNQQYSYTTANNNCFCISVPTSKDGPGITSVKVGATNFVNPNDIYHDFTDKAVNLAKGSASNVKIAFATGGVAYNTNIWIDYNDNFLFETSEKVFTGVSASAATTVLDGIIPASNAPLGIHRMRIGATFALITPANPCYAGDKGITLDFNINLVNAPLNDSSSAATILTVGKAFADNAITGSNNNATGSTLEATPACGNYNGGDVWYQAVVPSTGKLVFEINGLKDGLTNTAAAAYTSAMNLITCDDSSSTATVVSGDHPKITLVRPAGETIYFRVWDNAGAAYGNYQVSAYDDTASVLGNDTFEVANLLFYPNPVQDVLNISFDQEISDVTVLNMLGQQVKFKSVNANQVKLDMSDLSRGTYLVKVISGNQSKIIKAVKE